MAGDTAPRPDALETELIARERAAGTGVYVWRPADDVLIWSPRLIRLFGLTRTPTGEPGFSDLLHPDDRVRVEAETAGYLSSTATEYAHTFRIVRPDGGVRFLLDRGQIERDDRGCATIIRGMNIDLTGLPHLASQADAGCGGAYSALAHVEELEGLYDQAPLGLGLLNRELRFLRINAALAETNGIAPAAHIGRTVWELLPDLRQSAEPALLSVLETGVPLRDVIVKGETPARPGVVRE